MMLASICPRARRALLLVFAGAVSVQVAERIIVDHASSVATLSGRCVTGGRLDLGFLGLPARTHPASPVPLH
jgi:hypothetical protein